MRSTRAPSSRPEQGCSAWSLLPAHDQAPLGEERGHLRDVGQAGTRNGEPGPPSCTAGSLRSSIQR